MRYAAAVVCLFVLLILENGVAAQGQGGQLCIFSDPQGTDCTLSDTAPGLLQVYVIHTQTTDATAVWFAATKPPCATWTWLSDTYQLPVNIGDSQTGLAVEYGACLSSPIHLVTINYFSQGLTPPDCPYEIRPHPTHGGPIVLGCDSTYHSGYPSTTYVNSNLACTCNVGETPQLVVNPTSLDFGTTTETMSFAIENAGNGTLFWSLSGYGRWFRARPGEGVGNATIDVTVNRSSVPNGTYHDYISISSNGGSARVWLHMEVAGEPVLGVTPTSLQIPANSSNGAFSIWNAGAGSLQWNITSDQPWLSAVPTSGFNDDQVAVYVERVGLSPGTYSGHLFVTSNGGSATVEVEMIVSDAILVVEPLTLVFTPSETTKTFTISNGGTGTLDWSLELLDPWVSAAPMSGSNYGFVTVNVDFGSLPCCNMLLGHIRVNSNAGSQVVELKAYPKGPGTGGSIGIYADTQGTECNLSDATVGMTTYHVVHRTDFGMTACAYWAPKPSCFTATYLSDTNIFPVTIGNSQAGVSIGYGSCRPGPIHVQSIVYFTQGTTPQCCLYPVLGIPTSGNVEAVDCANHLLTAYGVTSVINPAGSCNCGAVRVEESTWGKVKSLYSE